MVARNSLRGSLLCGAACLALGLALGLTWPDAKPAPLWTEPGPQRSSSALPSFAAVVRQIGPGVVTVRAVRPVPREATANTASGVADGMRAVHAAGPRERSGSGFVVQAGGLCLTSRHVVVDAGSIEVSVPERGWFEAELIGEDLATDLALLRLIDAPDDLCALPLADGTDLEAGDWIVAVGNPLGFAQTVTAGIVSFVGRHLRHSDYAVTNDFLQISAPVNPGNSGCPVVDLHGRVVGVTTQAPIEGQGISFAVPGHSVKWALQQMQEVPDGRVRRGYLGIEFASVLGQDDDGNELHGAVIVQVVEGQPAHRAGVRPGDIVFGIDGKSVLDAKALHECIVRAQPGTEIALQVLRSGAVTDPIKAVLGEAAVRRADQPN